MAGLVSGARLVRDRRPGQGRQPCFIKALSSLARAPRLCGQPLRYPLGRSLRQSLACPERSPHLSGQANGPGRWPPRTLWSAGAGHRRWDYPSESHAGKCRRGGECSRHGDAVVFELAWLLRAGPGSRSAQRGCGLRIGGHRHCLPGRRYGAGEGRPTAGRLAADGANLLTASGRRGAGGLPRC